MKKLLLAAITLFPVSGFSVSFTTATVSPESKAQTRVCQLSTCAGDDQAATYTRVCSMFREHRRGLFNPDWLALRTSEGGKSCVCWCDYGYEQRARELSQGGGM